MTLFFEKDLSILSERLDNLNVFNGYSTTS
jgi:hypothetical protein